MSGRGVVVVVALLLTSTLVGLHIGMAAGFPVAADGLTLVRVPGAAPVKTCTVTPSSDTFLDEELPETPFGAEPYLAVASGPADRRALVRFDLSSCGIPAGAEVRSARLAMGLTDAPASPRAWRVQRVTSDWAAAEVTWSTAPTVAPAATDTAAIGTVAGVPVTWDVRADVALIVSGGATNRGWRIADVDESAPLRDGGAFAASEAVVAADRPSLTLTWFD